MVEYEMVKARHEERVADLLRSQMALEAQAERVEALERRRFFFRYQVRRILYRFAPRFAAELSM